MRREVGRLWLPVRCEVGPSALWGMSSEPWAMRDKRVILSSHPREARNHTVLIRSCLKRYSKSKDLVTVLAMVSSRPCAGIGFCTYTKCPECSFGAYSRCRTIANLEGYVCSHQVVDSMITSMLFPNNKAPSVLKRMTSIKGFWYFFFCSFSLDWRIQTPLKQDDA